MISKKVSMLGMWGVGKTSLVQQFVNSIYDEKYLSTIGVKVDKKVVDIADQSVNLMLWDIAGSEDHFSVPVHYIRGSHGYLLIMDGTRPESLEAGIELTSMVKEHIGEIPFIAVVNKCDLAWQVSDAEITDALAGAPWLRSSAKTGENVEEAFLALASAMS